MSFSHSLKTEITENRSMRARYKRAQAYGLLLFGRSFSAEGVSLRTEHLPTARLYTACLRDYAGPDAEISFSESRWESAVYTASLAKNADRLALLKCFHQSEGINPGNLPSPRHVHAFLAGAYLACGNIADPAKSYHMEFVVAGERLCRDLCALLAEYFEPPRHSLRRGSHVVYYKECAQIEDFITMIGAPKSSLAVVDVELFKDVRNRANRATNCETANIDRLVSAAAAQIEDIRTVLDRIGEESLSLPLRQAALLRLENPDASLRELCVLLPGGISRSGLHHRLAKLSQMAEKLREKEGEGDKNA